MAKGIRTAAPKFKGHRIVSLELDDTSPFAAGLSECEVVAVEVADEWNGLGLAPQSTVFSLRNTGHSVFKGALRIEVGYGNVRQIAAAAPLAVVRTLTKALAAAPLSDEAEQLEHDLIITDHYPSAKIVLECADDASSVRAWTFTTVSQAPSRAPWEVRVGKEVRWANGREVARALATFHRALARPRSPVKLIEAVDRATIGPSSRGSSLEPAELKKNILDILLIERLKMKIDRCASSIGEPLETRVVEGAAESAYSDVARLTSRTSTQPPRSRTAWPRTSVRASDRERVAAKYRRSPEGSWQVGWRPPEASLLRHCQFGHWSPFHFPTDLLRRAQALPQPGFAQRCC